MALLGVGAASAPLAAKAASETEIMRLAGAEIASGNIGHEDLAPGSPVSSGDWRQSMVSASDFIKLFGVPDHIEAGLRRDSQTIYRLDVDLAVKRSWSISVKFQEQRQRNYERKLAQMMRTGNDLRAQNLFKQTAGFDWPW